ncbi:MAG: hypothetical protein PHX61_09205 [Alphaproteobacteria bacterium]|nr:hypothetical protein [Alphaproteobacteria bacterium]
MITDLRGAFFRSAFVAGTCKPENLADYLELPLTDMVCNMLADRMREAAGEPIEERGLIYDTLAHFSHLYLKKYGCDYYDVERVQDIPDSVISIILWIAPFQQELPPHIFTSEAQEIEKELEENIKSPHLMGKDARFINLVDMHIGQALMPHLLPLVSDQLSQNTRQNLNIKRVAARGESLIEQDVRKSITSTENKFLSGGERFEVVTRRPSDYSFK